MFEITENVTVYRLAKIAGYENPQALYNLTRNGYGPKVQTGTDKLGRQYKYVTPADANEWLVKRAAKLAKAQSK